MSSLDHGARGAGTIGAADRGSGHGELGGGELITIYREYLEELREETRKLAANGQDADAIIGTLIPQMLGRHPDWDASEPWRIATAVQSFLAR